MGGLILVNVEITRNNHYIPQMYLRSWSKDKKNIYVYNILASHMNVPIWMTKNIRSIAYHKDLYTWNNGEYDTDEIEKWFAYEIENPTNQL